jgi:hypothetical protein
MAVRLQEGETSDGLTAGKVMATDSQQIVTSIPPPVVSSTSFFSDRNWDCRSPLTTTIFTGHSRHTCTEHDGVKQCIVVVYKPLHVS